MKKNNYYYLELNLIPNPLKESYVYPDNLCKSLSGPTYAYVSNEYINEELLDNFSKLNLTVIGAVLFKKLPGYSNPLHADVVLTDNKWTLWHAAVNWDLTNAESIMEWYSTSEKEVWPKLVESDKPYLLSGIHYGFLGNRDTASSTMTLLESVRVVGPTLVRTNIPHQIKNLDSIDRWSLSIRFNKNHSWEELIEIFSS